MTERIRKPPRRRTAPDGLTPEIIECLLHGSCLFAPVVLDNAEARILWRDHEQALLPDWILRHPGNRPFAWWLAAVLEHGPRRQVKPGPRPLSQPTWFGIAALWEAPPPDDMHETQRTYLQRHGLLEFHEARLTATDGPVWPTGKGT